MFMPMRRQRGLPIRSCWMKNALPSIFSRQRLCAERYCKSAGHAPRDTGEIPAAQSHLSLLDLSLSHSSLFEAAAHQNQLVDALISTKVLTSEQVIQTFRRVDRGLFLQKQTTSGDAEQGEGTDSKARFGGVYAEPYRDEPIKLTTSLGERNSTMSTPSHHALIAETLYKALQGMASSKAAERAGPLRVLDLGCGSGYLCALFYFLGRDLASSLHRSSVQVVGVEAIESLLSLSEENVKLLGIPVVQSPLATTGKERGASAGIVSASKGIESTETESPSNHQEALLSGVRFCQAFETVSDTALARSENGDRQEWNRSWLNGKYDIIHVGFSMTELDIEQTFLPLLSAEGVLLAPVSSEVAATPVEEESTIPPAQMLTLFERSTDSKVTGGSGMRKSLISPVMCM